MCIMSVVDLNSGQSHGRGSAAHMAQGRGSPESQLTTSCGGAGEQSVHQLQEVKEALGTQQLSIQTHMSPFTQVCAVPQPLKPLCNKLNGGSQKVGPSPKPTYVNESFFRALGRRGRSRALGHGAPGLQENKLIVLSSPMGVTGYGNLAMV